MKVTKSDTKEIIVEYQGLNGEKENIVVYPWSNGMGYCVSMTSKCFDISLEEWDAMKLAIDHGEYLEANNE